MRYGFLFLFYIFAMFREQPASAQALRTEGLTPGGAGLVTSILDGDTIVLEDGRTLRLVGIQAPKLPLGRPDFEVWPLGDAAKSALSDLTLGQKINLFHGGREQDRHGRILAQIINEKGQWVQAALLHQGMARVYSFADNRARINELYPYEDDARKAVRGIWNHPFYARLKADEINAQGAKLADQYTIIEGVLISTNLTRSTLYLNFGHNWGEDLTVQISKRSLKSFKDAWITGLDALTGQRLEVRGWTRDHNGPMIEITHPEQIRFLDETK